MYWKCFSMGKSYDDDDTQYPRALYEQFVVMRINLILSQQKCEMQQIIHADSCSCYCCSTATVAHNLVIIFPSFSLFLYGNIHNKKKYD